MDVTTLPELVLPTAAEFADGMVGPLVIDKQTFDRFVYLTNADIIQFTEDPSPLIFEDEGELTRMFAMKVSVPSSNRYAEDHRAFALQASIRELQERRRVIAPVLEDGPRTIGNLDVWMAIRRQSFLDGGWAPDQVDMLFSELFMLTPDQVQLVTQIPVTVLANWRSRSIGPEFVKMSGRPSIRYPAASIISWISGQQ